LCAHTVNDTALQPISNYIVYCSGSIENSNRQPRGRFEVFFLLNFIIYARIETVLSFDKLLLGTSKFFSFFFFLLPYHGPRGWDAAAVAGSKNRWHCLRDDPNPEKTAARLYIYIYMLHSQWAGYIMYVHILYYVCCASFERCFFLFSFFHFV